MVGRMVRGNDGRKVDLVVLIAGMDNIPARQGSGITWESQGIRYFRSSILRDCDTPSTVSRVKYTPLETG